MSCTPQPYKFDVQKVREAAKALRDLMVHGCLLCDDVGFGKTKQGLLIAYLHQLLVQVVDDKMRGFVELR